MKYDNDTSDKILEFIRAIDDGAGLVFIGSIDIENDRIDFNVFNRLDNDVVADVVDAFAAEVRNTYGGDEKSHLNIVSD